MTHFVPLRTVGRGGFGRVQAVERCTTGERLAIKTVAKARLVSSRTMVQTAWVERNLMSKVDSPFLLNSYHCFQDRDYIHIVMPFMSGGDLDWYITSRAAMDESMARFYGSQIILGMQAMHKMGYLYRDLKPENVLFNHLGNIKVSDFGLAVLVKDSDKFMMTGRAGTPGFMPPEMLDGKAYSFQVDFFSFGCTLAALVLGNNPFRSNLDVQEKTLSWDDEGKHFSKDIIDLTTKLLDHDPATRLGATNGWDDVKAHPFFKSIDWESIAQMEVKPPFKPNVLKANCSGTHELEAQLIGEEKPRTLTAEEQNMFVGWEYRVKVSELSPAERGLPKDEKAK